MRANLAAQPLSERQTNNLDSLPAESVCSSRQVAMSMSQSATTASASTLLEDAELALQNLAHQEAALIKETESLFKDQVDYLRRIDQLRRYAPDMSKVDKCTKELMSYVNSSASLVDDVCGRVKSIDLAKERLEDCLSKVADILDLKKCRQGMKAAMDSCNYEEAAMYLKRFLAIHKDELEKTIKMISGSDESLPQQASKPLFDTKLDLPTDQNMPSDGINEIMDPKSMELALGELEESRIKFLELCQNAMTLAIKEDDNQTILRFLKLFPMLNEHMDGLTKYAYYLQTKMIDEQVSTRLESSEISQADKLAALYEGIAKLVDQNQPLIETFFGPGYLIVVVKILQKECDRLSRKILEEFRNITKLQYVAKMVKAAAMQSPIVNFQGHNIGANFAQTLNLQPAKLDPRDVDTILNQIALIISRSGVYLNFLVERVKDDIKSKVESETQRQASLLELYNLLCIDCELNHLVQEVGGVYVMLEQFYLNESSKKAILMDQVDTESSGYPVSSMLDDIFFIVKKCINRSISTKSIDVFCAIINHCVTLLESVFCQVLDDRLKSHQCYSTAFTTKNLDLSQAYSVIQSGRYLQSASELETARAQYFSALNNLDKACDYTQILRGILDLDVKKLKPPMLVIEQQLDNQVEKSITCLNDLSQLVGRFSSIANSSLYQLFNSALRNRIKAELKVIVQENPDLTRIVLESSAELTGLAKDLLSTMDKSLQSSLTVENYSKLTVITRDFLATLLKSLK